MRQHDSIKNRKGSILAFLCLLFLANSCTSVYVPNALNVPMFSGKKEFQASVQGQLYFPSITSGFNAQTAYSFSNHLGIMANYGFSKNSDIVRSYIVETGLGYYRKKGELYYDCFLGYGISKGSSRNVFDLSLLSYSWNGTPARLDTHYNRVFLQPSIAYQGDIFTIGYSVRVSLIHFQNTYTDRNNQELATVNRTPVYYWEPTGSASVSVHKHVKLIGQAGINITHDDDHSLGGNVFSFSLGARFCLSQKLTSRIP